MKTTIETKRLLIREINTHDIDCLLKIYHNPENLRFIPNTECTWTKEKLMEKYNRINQDYENGFGIYVVIVKNRESVIGEAGLFNSFQNLKHLELGYILDNKYWRKGYGSEICKSLIDFGFNKLKLDKLSARMFMNNIASIRVSEKCVMKLISQGRTEKGESFCEYEIKNQNKI